MHFRVRFSLALGAILVGCGTWAFAQQTGTGSKETTTQKAVDEDDLAELAKELEAADADEQAAAARQTLSDSQTRARRQAMEARDRLLKDPRWRPTHKQVDRFEVQAPLNNMCLDAQGRILACCGDKKIRVFSPQGELLETRSLAFSPEAIGTRSSDGAIFVAGQGKLVRMSVDGELQDKATFPPAPTEEEKQAIVKQMLKRSEEQAKQMQQMVNGIKTQLDALKKELAKEELPEEEEGKIAKMSEMDLFESVQGISMTEDELKMSFKEGTKLHVQARVMELYLKQLGGVDVAEQQARMEEQIRKQVEQGIGTATFTGLAVADDDLFVICSGPGYSYNAWRLTHDFQRPKRILTGLSGCCGQMDCQTHDGNLWLAMNTQHKVLRYDRDGEELSGFGKNDAEAADGFGGCCEPKNLRFSSDGKYVYCAQSGPPVCVKRFTLEGEFQDVICYPIYDTGCVRVSVDVHGDTFFMMSPNEKAIYVFQPVGTEAGAE